jgi:uncharacterized protein YecE (DUF72 family)
MTSVRIGTAGWTVPHEHSASFPSEGTSLERYSTRFSAAEINSSFHRPHRASTWERWRDSVPGDFRFSVKLSKTITHQKKLLDCDTEVAAFIDQASILGTKFAVLLVQLPPKLSFDAEVAERFFALLRQSTSAQLACEPRHPGWFSEEADTLLAAHMVARVAADPAICDAAARPGGWRGLAYWRLHGSPVIYRSSYEERIPDYHHVIVSEADPGAECWCIFDNTASSAAMGDALALQAAFGRA